MCTWCLTFPAQICQRTYATDGVKHMTRMHVVYAVRRTRPLPNLRWKSQTDDGLDFFQRIMPSD